MRLTVNMGTSPTLPRRLELAQIRCLAGTAEAVAKAIGDASRSSQIAAATYARPTGPSSAEVVVGEGVPFARIRDQGGTIVPRRASVLRFATGEFRPFVRQRGIRYIARAEAEMPDRVRGAYARAFGIL